MKRNVFHHIVLVLLLAVSAAVAFAAANDRETIIVGGNSAYPPYEFLDKDGKPAGFAVDLTRAIADVMGFEVKIRLGSSWTEMRKALEREEIDILQGISHSEERERTLDFAPAHSFVSHSIFARKGAAVVHSLDELSGKEVILLGRGIMHDFFEQSGLQVRAVPAPTISAALMLLGSGEHDYAVLATLPALYLVRELDIKGVELAARGIDTKKYGYAVKKGNLAVLEKFSDGMAILKHSGKYKELQDKWLADAEAEAGPTAWAYRHRFIVVASLVLVLGVSIVWSASLKRQVEIRTAALEHEVEERKRAAEALKLHQQQLVQADKMAALGVLVSGMAHEINNPNGLILLNLPTVAEAAKDIEPILEKHLRENGDFKMGGLPYSQMRTEIPHLLNEMQGAAKRIKHIVDDLKHFSRRSDACYDDLIDINEVVKTSVRLVDNSLRKATNRYTVHYTGKLPSVRGNFQRLEQVLVNLILNACQSLPGPDRGIFVSTLYSPESKSVVIKVTDEGVGIPKEHLPRLTDPFFTTKRESGGTGLGLAISDGIVREHGGTIEFESIPGEGTTVIILLPAAEQEVRA